MKIFDLGYSDKGWSLPYAQYLEVQLGSQYGHWITEVFALRSQDHEGFPNGHRQNSKLMDVHRIVTVN